MFFIAWHLPIVSGNFDAYNLMLILHLILVFRVNNPAKKVGTIY